MLVSLDTKMMMMMMGILCLARVNTLMGTRLWTM